MCPEKSYPYILFGNYGNNTIALIQWCIEKNIQQLTVVSVDTGFAEPAWLIRIKEAEQYCLAHGFKVERLKALESFQDCVRQRGQFPSQKFQWCAGLLKGVTLLDWLDVVDIRMQYTIMLAKRKNTALGIPLSEWIERSEHYGERRVWHPLFDCAEAEYHRLIQSAGFDILPHQSMECAPCIHASDADFARLSQSAIARTDALEKEIGQPMFHDTIEKMVSKASISKTTSSRATVDMGCGDPYACGI